MAFRRLKATVDISLFKTHRFQRWTRKGSPVPKRIKNTREGQSKAFLNVQHRTLNVEHRMMNSLTQRRRLGRVSLGHFIKIVNISYSIFDVGRWTLDVRRSCPFRFTRSVFDIGK
jgi:hypothetical protein